MANEPRGPITALCQVLAQQPALKKAQIPVLPGRKAKSTAARRIKIYPKRGAALPASDPSSSLLDIEQVMVAECWGADVDQAWFLLVCLVQALESQAVGDDTDGPGYAWQAVDEEFEIEPDVSSQGELTTFLFSCRFAIPSEPYDIGHLGNWPLGLVAKGQQDEPETRTVTEGDTDA